MYMTHLACARDGSTCDGEKLHNLSDVCAPLIARYDLEKAAVKGSASTCAQHVALSRGDANTV